MTTVNSRIADGGRSRGMAILLGLIEVLAVPLSILNLVGGIVSGVWLVALGRWSLVIAGILFFLLSFGLSVVLAPSLLFSAPGVHFAEKGKLLPMLFLTGLGNLYTTGIVTGWCYLVLSCFAPHAVGPGRVPILIWSYGIATGPWAYTAQRERDGFASSFLAFLVELACATVVVLLICVPAARTDASVVFLGFMLVGLVVQTVVTFVVGRELARDGAEGLGDECESEP